MRSEGYSSHHVCVCVCVCVSVCLLSHISSAAINSPSMDKFRTNIMFVCARMCIVGTHVRSKRLEVEA